MLDKDQYLPKVPTFTTELHFYVVGTNGEDRSLVNTKK